jgi:hypothetical protein
MGVYIAIDHTPHYTSTNRSLHASLHEGVYIVMGIGADDIFVFVDAWKQSAYEGPDVLVDLETRMSFVYSRAGYAMLITSTTTCFAFIATALSPLVEVQSFGMV